MPIMSPRIRAINTEAKRRQIILQETYDAKELTLAEYQVLVRITEYDRKRAARRCRPVNRSRLSLTA